jgi:hypothetical protein
MMSQIRMKYVQLVMEVELLIGLTIVMVLVWNVVALIVPNLTMNVNVNIVKNAKVII